MEIKAELNHLRMAPRKVRLVADLVRGMSSERARLELTHLPKRSAEPILKLLQSALANAKHNFQIGEKGLYLKKVDVNPGPVSKRFEPRAFGRAAPIRGRTSHVLLVLEAKETARRKDTKARPGGSPMVREVTAEDVKGEDEARSKDKISRPGETFHGKNMPGFVKRVFRRKAI